MLVEHRHNFAASERWFPGQQFVEGTPQAVEIRSFRMHPPPDHFGSQIENGPGQGLGRACHAGKAAGPGALQPFGQTKITDDDALLVFIKKDIAGFDVPVQDALLVGKAQTGNRLLQPEPDLAGRLGALGPQNLAQGLAAHQFHNNVVVGIGDADIVDRHNIGMFQAGQNAGLPLEETGGFRAGREFFVENFDRNFPFQADVNGPIDDTKAALAQESLDLIAFRKELADH